MTTYDRPVRAQLIVRLENGDEWEATDDDFAKFGLGNRLKLYSKTIAVLTEGLGLEPGTDLTRHEPQGPNLVRYLIECALMYDHTPWADEHGQPWPEDDEVEGPGFRERLQAALRGTVDADQEVAT